MLAKNRLDGRACHAQVGGVGSETIRWKCTGQYSAALVIGQLLVPHNGICRNGDCKLECGSQIIPGGCTGMCQPIDVVGIGKPLKTR